MTIGTLLSGGTGKGRERKYLLYFLSLLVLSTLVFLSGCGNSTPDPNIVKVPENDSTPASVILDIYNIPLQPGASSQPNPESVNSSCCDFTRKVKRNTTLTLIAGGKDEDGGITYIAIKGNVEGVCLDITANDIDKKFKTDTILQENTDSAKPGDFAQNSRIVQLNISVQKMLEELCPDGVAPEGAAITVHAETSNFYAGPVLTKSVSFQFP
jgi:hypothetical protein